MLHIAVVNGHAHVLAYLLGILLAECESSSARAELEDCSAVLMTTAAEYGHADVIYVLATQLHADVNASSSVATTTTDSVHGTETRNEDGLTRQHSTWPPLFSAAEYSSVDAIHALIDLGADVHAVTVSGATPLHIAAENG
ncbi:ankyrin repeat protein, putative, partial [Bodo saltans]